MNKILGLAAGLTVAAIAAPSLAQAQTAYTTDLVNLRAGPGLDYPVVLEVQQGQPMQSFGCLQDWSWCDVAIGDYRGWMAGDFITYASDNGPGGPAYVPLDVYGPRYGVPIISFEFGPYWDRWYSGRPWYRDRAHWAQYDWHRHAWNGNGNWAGRHDYDHWNGGHWNNGGNWNHSGNGNWNHNGNNGNWNHNGNNGNWNHSDNDHHDGNWNGNNNGNNGNWNRRSDNQHVVPFKAPGQGQNHNYATGWNANRPNATNNRSNPAFGNNGDPSQHSGANAQPSTGFRGTPSRDTVNRHVNLPNQQVNTPRATPNQHVPNQRVYAPKGNDKGTVNRTPRNDNPKVAPRGNDRPRDADRGNRRDRNDG